ncbi:MAG: tetratricopeptide repeat protein, partial [Pseudomonadota bacterium]
MALNADTVYRFADCELDVAARSLMRAGKPVGLQPRVFDLLAFLIAQRERAVDKDAIQDAVWSPVVVSETALTRAIMKARRAVGDDAEQQAIIRTVHGHGYQFVAPLRATGDGPVPAQTPASTPEQALSPTPPRAPTATPSVPKSRPAFWLVAVAVLCVLAVIANSVWRTPVAADAVRLAVMPVQNNTGDTDFDYVELGLMGLANGLFVDHELLDIVRAADVMQYVASSDWQPAAAEQLTHVTALAETYGASHVVVASLEHGVGGLRLNFTLTDTKGRALQSTMVAGQSTQLVRGMVRDITESLTRRRHVLADEVSIDSDPFINEAFARALATALEGRCAEAVPLLDVVLSRSPSLARARFIRADCEYRLGRWESAERSYRAMTLNEDGADAVVATAYAGLGKVLHRTGRLELAGTAYNTGLAIAERIQDREAIGRVLISMAILAKDRREFSRARDLLARATHAYRQLERTVLPGHLFSTAANISMSEGKLAEAEQQLEDALRSFRHVGDRANEAMMLNNFGYLRRRQGRIAEAEPLHLQSLEIRRDIGDVVGQGRILGMLSTLYLREGRLEDARSAAAQAVTVAREANDKLFVATGLAQLGAAQLESGQTDAARLAYTESEEIFVSIEDVARAAQVRLRLADVDVASGNVDAAQARIARVLEQAIQGDLHEPAI